MIKTKSQLPKKQVKEKFSTPQNGGRGYALKIKKRMTKKEITDLAEYALSHDILTGEGEVYGEVGDRITEELINQMIAEGRTGVNGNVNGFKISDCVPANVVQNSQPKELSDKQPRGRPPEHQENWSKITVTLLDRQIHWLDHLASSIRLNTRTAISRTELIRALVSAVEGSELDLSQLKNESEITEHILQAYSKK